MLVYQLFLLPSPDTMVFLKQQISPPPFDIDYDKFAVCLYTSTHPIPEDPSRTFSAYCRKLERVYNSQLDRSDWIMTLDSPDMQKEYTALQGEAPDAFYKECFPHMALVEGMPQATQSVRNFRVSMENVFNDNKVELIFGNALCVSKDINYPPDYDYQQLKLIELQRGYDRIDL